MTQAGTSFYTRQTYFPYGAQRTTEGNTLPTDYTFTGQKNDDSTGLMFYGARYYDVTLGRFISADAIVPNPLNPQSLNRFSYVLNNPVKYTDPTGHAEVCDDPSCGANPPSNPSNNGEVPTSPAAPPVNPPADSPTNPNPEQGDDCKRHCDDADRADGGNFQTTNNRILQAIGHGNLCAFCQYRVPIVTAMGPIDDPGSGDAAVAGGGLGLGYAIARWVEQIANGAAKVPPSAIRFTQDTVSWATKKGVPLDTLTQEIDSGKFQGSINVVIKDGLLWSLDNRRLAAFKLLDQSVPITLKSLSDPLVLSEWNRKFTTITEGLSIAVKDTEIIIK